MKLINDTYIDIDLALVMLESKATQYQSIAWSRNGPSMGLSTTSRRIIKKISESITVNTGNLRTYPFEVKTGRIKYKH
jgi:hypothetical protein